MLSILLQYFCLILYHIYIVNYCILIVCHIIGLRVFHGLINLNQLISLIFSLSLLHSIVLHIALQGSNENHENLELNCGGFTYQHFFPINFIVNLIC